MLFVEVPWGRIAWTDFVVLDTKTMRFPYIEDGFAYSTIEQQEEAESFNGYGLNDEGTNGKINSHIFGIEGKVIRIHKTSDILRSITVKLIKPLPTSWDGFLTRSPEMSSLFTSTKNFPTWANFRW